MPTVKDAPMILVGHVSNVEPTLEFLSREDRAAGKVARPDGAKVLISAADGFSVVKLKEDKLREVEPALGARIAWVVRPIHWEQDDRAGMSVGFVRPVDFADIDFIGSALGRTEAVPA